MIHKPTVKIQIIVILIMLFKGILQGTFKWTFKGPFEETFKAIPKGRLSTDLSLKSKQLIKRDNLHYSLKREVTN